MKTHICAADKVLSCDRERPRAGVQEVKMGDAFCHDDGPTAAAATDVGANSAAGRQCVSGKNPEIFLKNVLALGLVQFVFALRE
jgi:hypothetical protein